MPHVSLMPPPPLRSRRYSSTREARIPGVQEAGGEALTSAPLTMAGEASNTTGSTTTPRTILIRRAPTLLAMVGARTVAPLLRTWLGLQGEEVWGEVTTRTATRTAALPGTLPTARIRIMVRWGGAGARGPSTDRWAVGGVTGAGAP